MIGNLDKQMINVEGGKREKLTYFLCNLWTNELLVIFLSVERFPFLKYLNFTFQMCVKKRALFYNKIVC